jgi:hypothetical protein
VNILSEVHGILDIALGDLMYAQMSGVELESDVNGISALMGRIACLAQDEDEVDNSLVTKAIQSAYHEKNIAGYDVIAVSPVDWKIICSHVGKEKEA